MSYGGGGGKQDSSTVPAVTCSYEGGGGLISLRLITARLLVPHILLLCLTNVLASLDTGVVATVVPTEAVSSPLVLSGSLVRPSSRFEQWLLQTAKINMDTTQVKRMNKPIAKPAMTC